jgi:hypothetical protein
MANFQLDDTQKVAYALVAFDAANNPAQVAAGDVISVSSSDVASATVVPDAVPAAGSLASGFIVSGSKAQVGVQITASAKKADGSLDLQVVDLIDVVSAAASSLGLSLGKPVPKP